MSVEDWAYGILDERMRKSTMAREQQPVDYSELSQLRAEVAMLRGELAAYRTANDLTEAQKRERAAFEAWVALTAEEKTQLVADKKFANDPGELWEVQLQEHPKVRLPATSRFDAIGKYQELCGITATAHEFSAVVVNAAA